MATLDDSIEAIATLLRTISGVGVVLDYGRYTDSEAARIAAFVDAAAAPPILNCWIITREATHAEDLAMGPKIRDRHKVAIHGYRAVQSGATSERLHQELAETVRAKLHANRILAGSVGQLTTPVQVERFGAVMFIGNVLCWYAKLSMTVEVLPIGG